MWASLNYVSGGGDPPQPHSRRTGDRYTVVWNVAELDGVCRICRSSEPVRHCSVLSGDSKVFVDCVSSEMWVDVSVLQLPSVQAFLLSREFTDVSKKISEGYWFMRLHLNVMVEAGDLFSPLLRGKCVCPLLGKIWKMIKENCVTAFC